METFSFLLVQMMPREVPQDKVEHELSLTVSQQTSASTCSAQEEVVYTQSEDHVNVPIPGNQFPHATVSSQTSQVLFDGTAGDHAIIARSVCHTHPPSSLPVEFDCKFEENAVGVSSCLQTSTPCVVAGLVSDGKATSYARDGTLTSQQQTAPLTPLSTQHSIGTNASLHMDSGQCCPAHQPPHSSSGIMPCSDGIMATTASLLRQTALHNTHSHTTVPTVTGLLQPFPVHLDPEQDQPHIPTMDHSVQQDTQTGVGLSMSVQTQTASSNGSLNQAPDHSLTEGVSASRHAVAATAFPEADTCQELLSDFFPAVGQSFSAHGLTVNYVLQWMRPFPLVDIVMDASVLETNEYASLMKMEDSYPAVEVNCILLDVVSRKDEFRRGLFVHLLARTQPHIMRTVSEREPGMSSEGETAIVSGASVIESRDYLPVMTTTATLTIAMSRVAAAHGTSKLTLRQTDEAGMTSCILHSGSPEGGFPSGQQASTHDAIPLRSALPGSGACSLPVWLHEAQPQRRTAPLPSTDTIQQTSETTCHQSDGTLQDSLRYTSPIGADVLPPGKTSVACSSKQSSVQHLQEIQLLSDDSDCRDYDTSLPADLELLQVSEHTTDSQQTAQGDGNSFLHTTANKCVSSNLASSLGTVSAGPARSVSAADFSQPAGAISVLSATAKAKPMLFTPATTSSSTLVPDAQPSPSSTAHQATCTSTSELTISAARMSGEHSIAESTQPTTVVPSPSNTSQGADVRRVDWMRLLAVISNDIKDLGTCKSLAIQLHIMTDPKDDPVYHLFKQYPYDPIAIAAELFRAWLCKPAIAKLSDDEKREQLTMILSERMRRYDLTSVMEQTLPQLTVSDLEATPGNFLPSLGQIDQPTSPNIQRFLQHLRKQASRLASVSPIDFLDEGIDTVDGVYITVTSLSYGQARRLLQQQRNMGVEQLAQLAQKAKADMNDGVDLDNVEILLRKKGDDTPINRSLVLGGGGSGKTVLCRKILHDWNNPKLPDAFKQFWSVVYISGRDSARIHAAKPSQFLGLASLNLDNDQRCEIVEFLSKNSDRVLVLVDGGDEVGRGGLLHEGTVLTDMLHGHGTFPEATILITSRPCPEMFECLERCAMERIFSLVGFKETRIRQLARRRLGENETERFCRELKSPSKAGVKAAAQETPLFAALLVQMFQDEEVLPFSVTELYNHVFSHALYRNAQRLVERKWQDKKQQLLDREHEDLHLSKNHQTNIEVERQGLLQSSQGLCRLALDALAYKRFTFTSDEVHAYCSEDGGKMGFLTPMRNFGGEMGEVYTFAHLSWQEFFAAKRLVSLADFSNSLTEVLNRVGCSEYTWLFWRFVAGLVPIHLLPELIFQLCHSMDLTYSSSTHTQIRNRYFLASCIAEQRSMTAANHFITLATSCLFPGGDMNFPGYCPRLFEVSALQYVIEHALDLQILDISGSGIGEEEMNTLARVLHHPELVKISGNNLTTACFHNICQSFASSRCLNYLHMVACSITDEHCEEMKHVLACCQTLETLYLEKNCFGPTGVVSMFSAVHSQSRLKSVFLSSNKLCGLDGHAFGKLLCNATHLEVLDVGECELSDEAVSTLVQQLPAHFSLCVLCVRKNNLTAAVLPAVVSFSIHRYTACLDRLGCTPQQASVPVLTVDMSNNDISVIDLNCLVDTVPTESEVRVRLGLHGVINGIFYSFGPEYFRQNSHYGSLGLGDEDLCQAICYLQDRSMYLYHNQIRDRGVTSVAEHLTTNKSIHILDLQHNCFGLTGTLALGDVLSQQNSTLTFINLGWNRIFTENSASAECVHTLLCKCNFLKGLLLYQTGLSDKHLKPLSTLRASFGFKLMLLDLGGNAITDAGVEVLGPAVARSKMLRYIGLSECELTDAGAQTLAMAVTPSASTYTCNNHLVCIWVGGNQISTDFFEDCPSDYIMNSSLDRQIKLGSLAETYLSHDENNQSSVESHTWRCLGFLESSALFAGLQECIHSEDVSGFVCLMFRIFRSVSTCHLPGTPELKRFLCKLIKELQRGLRIRNPLVRCAVACSSLCVTHELAVDDPSAGNLVHRHLKLLAACLAASPHLPVADFLRHLADLFLECGRPDIGALLCDHIELIKRGLL